MQGTTLIQAYITPYNGVKYFNCVQMILSLWQILGKVAALVKWNDELPKFPCRLIITFT